MGDKFPKSYVLDRIEARKGSLTIKIDADERRLADWKQRQEAALDSAFEQNKAHVEQAASRLRKAEKAYAKADGYDAKRQVLTDHFKSWSPTYTVGIDDRLSRYDDENSPGKVAKRLKEYRTEYSDIEHARLHLQEMPVDEFTMATLRSLGLLSVLKFDLASAREQEKGR
jgi:hypothetical protein